MSNWIFLYTFADWPGMPIFNIIMNSNGKMIGIMIDMCILLRNHF